MSEIAISVENLGKRYRIGVAKKKSSNLIESTGRLLTAPFEYLRSVNRVPSEDETIWALKDLAFEIKRGEVVGIIGRNGAGKSTLLKILSRITEPSEGRAKVNGRVGSLLEVGTGFHPELTGRENIYMNGAILGMRKAEIDRKFDEIIAFAEVEKFIDTPVKHYSSGMYVRLAFAVAAHLEPEILVVDEVLAVGDLQFQKKCLGKMQDVSQAGRTILFVSHNMAAITKLCSRSILLNQGRLVTLGKTEDVVATYLSDALGATGIAEWKDPNQSPGTNGFKLVSVSITDEADTPVSVANIQQSLQLKIGYTVEEPNLQFRCMAIFYTRGILAFPTGEPTEVMHERVGLYYSTVQIPGNLLAEGEYLVSVSVFASRGKKMHYCKAHDVVAFQVYDPVTGHSARGDYAEGLDGVMRPKLPWQTAYVTQ